MWLLVDGLADVLRERARSCRDGKGVTLAVLGGTINVARAGLNYQTDLESPYFAPGSVGSQDGWADTGTIQTSVFSSGAQALQVEAGQTGFARLGSFGIGTNTLRIAFGLLRYLSRYFASRG